MDGEAWWTTVYGIAKSRTRLNDFTYLLTILRGFSFALGRGVSPHSSPNLSGVSLTLDVGYLLMSNSAKRSHCS